MRLTVYPAAPQVRRRASGRIREAPACDAPSGRTGPYAATNEPGDQARCLIPRSQIVDLSELSKLPEQDSNL